MENNYSDLSKEDLIENIKIAVENIDRLEKKEKLLNRTEDARLRLLQENIELKKEFGKLKTAKILMEKAELYLYEDLKTEHKEVQER